LSRHCDVRETDEELSDCRELLSDTNEYYTENSNHSKMYISALFDVNILDTNQVSHYNYTNKELYDSMTYNM